MKPASSSSNNSSSTTSNASSSPAPLRLVTVDDLVPDAIYNSDVRGWLASPGETMRDWRMRYFVLKDDLLFCFAHESSAAASGVLSLSGFKLRSAELETKEKKSMKAYHPSGRAFFVVGLGKDDAQRWYKALVRAGTLVPSAAAVGSLSPAMLAAAASVPGGAAPAVDSTGSISSISSIGSIGMGANASASPQQQQTTTTTAASSSSSTTMNGVIRQLMIVPSKLRSRNSNSGATTPSPAGGGLSAADMASLSISSGNSSGSGAAATSPELYWIPMTTNLQELPGGAENGPQGKMSYMSVLMEQPVAYPKGLMKKQMAEINNEAMREMAAKFGGSSGKRSSNRWSFHGSISFGSSNKSGRSASHGNIVGSSGNSSSNSNSNSRVGLMDSRDQFLTSATSAGSISSISQGATPPSSKKLHYGSLIAARSTPNMHRDTLRSSSSGSDLSMRIFGYTSELGVRTKSSNSLTDQDAYGSPSPDSPVDPNFNFPPATSTAFSPRGSSSSITGRSRTMSRKGRESTASMDSGRRGRTSSTTSSRAETESSSAADNNDTLSPMSTPRRSLASSVENIAADARALLDESDFLPPMFREGYLDFASFESVEDSSSVLRHRDSPFSAGGLKTYWFILDDFFLRAYETPESSECSLEFTLDGCTYSALGEEWLQIIVSEYVDTPENPSSSENRVLMLRSTTTDDRDQWLSVINEMKPYFTTASEAVDIPSRKTDQDFIDEVERITQQHTQPRKFAKIESWGISMDTTRDEVVSSSPAPAKAASASSSLLALEPPTPITWTQEAIDGAGDNDEERQARIVQEGLNNHQTVLFPMKGLKEGGFLPETGSSLSEEEKAKYHLSLKGLSSEEGGQMKMLMNKSGLIYHIDSNSGQLDRYLIVAGRLPLLVARLADETHPDSHYIDIFLLTYRHFMSAKELVQHLMTRLNVVLPFNATQAQRQYHERWARVIQVRTIGVVKKWLDTLWWPDFAEDAEAHRYLNKFLSVAESSEDLRNLVQRLRKIIVEQTSSHILNRPRPQLESSEPADASKPLKLDFAVVDPREFARQWTMADHRKFSQIHPVEFLLNLWYGPSDQTVNLTNFIQWFNLMSFVTATSICQQGDLKKRARVMENWIKIGYECYRLRNYNSTVAVISALSMAAVRRLKKTWGLIPPKYMANFQEMEALMNTAKNYHNYRDIMSKLDRLARPGASIPFIGLLLRDLTFLNDGNPKEFNQGLINFGKCRMIGQRVLRLQVYQQAQYSFPLSNSRYAAPIREFLEMPQPITSDNTLFQLSLQHEPRDKEAATGSVSGTKKGNAKTNLGRSKSIAL